MVLFAVVGLCAVAAPAVAAPVLQVGLTNDANEIQQISVLAAAGQFRLGFEGDTTTDLPFDATPGQIQSALNALPSITAGGGSVSVLEGEGDRRGTDPYVVSFDGGPLAHTDVSSLSWTNGSTPLSDGAGGARILLDPSQQDAGVSRSDQRVDYRATVANVGATATSGAVTLEVALPAGAQTSAFRVGGAGWTCQSLAPAGPQPARATCTRSDALAPSSSFEPVTVAAALGADAPDDAIARATASGGAASLPAVASDEFAFQPLRPFDLTSLTTQTPDENGAQETRAGAHPLSAGASFGVSHYRVLNPAYDPPFDGSSRVSGYRQQPIENVNNILTDTPRGFLGNPLAVPELCPTIVDVKEQTCPLGSLIGGVSVRLPPFLLFNVPLYAIKPERGAPAQFAFVVRAVDPGLVYTLKPRLRADDGYGISLDAAPTGGNPALISVAEVALCSYGAKQVGQGASNEFEGCRKHDDLRANAKPLVTLPTRCGETPPTTRVHVDSWQDPGVFKSRSFAAPAVTACDAVRFDPSVDLTPTSQAADSASGLNVDLTMPTDSLTSSAGAPQASLKKTVVTLPEGMSINPSAAAGLQACSDAQLALGTNDPATCPEGSKIGTVDVATPVLKEHLTGDMVLRTPTSTVPESGDMFRLAIVIRSDERGILVKLPGSAVADPQTGRLTATFDDNPELPFSALQVKLKAGQRGVLALPQTCGQTSIGTELSPWKGDANTGATIKSGADAFAVGGDCSFGFAPTQSAGNSSAAAGGTGTFSLTYARKDGEQWVRGVTATLPTGLLADLHGVPVCSGADADAGSCPEGSRIGTVDASAGSGTPFVLERKGSAYLTDGYKGCAYGLDVTVPVIAGPFDASSPQTDLGSINVRSAICVDPIDAHVTVTSDPLPTIWHGIPLRARSITVAVDRPGFMRNPTSCEPKAIGGTLLSTQGVTAPVSSPFQVDGCQALDLKPKLALSLTGKGQTTDAKHPGVEAVLTHTAGQANLKRVEVQLPLSLALDPDNAQALCEFADGSTPTPTCPATSIVGSATAVTPILNEPLKGPVYFVKNIRIDAKTGRQIKTLPKLVIPLVGEHGLKLTLTGSSAVPDGKHLVNTFTAIPDAPVSRFELKITGGKHGILTVSGADICKETQVATRQIDGQNGKQADGNIIMSTPCRLATVASSHTSKALKLTVGGIGAGKLSVSGKGIAKTSRTITSATTATLAPRLTTSVRQRLAAHRNVKVKLTLTFTPKGAKKAKVVRETLVVHGAKRKR